jgi:hypothetical protein
MGRSHSVSFDGEPDLPRSDRSARLRQFEAAIVIWSEPALASKGILSIAAEALALNMLVSVRPDGIGIDRLPLAFRKLNGFTTADVDGMARLVSRFSSASNSLKQMQTREEERKEAHKRGLPTEIELERQREKERKERERLEAQLAAARKRERERKEKERLEAELAEAERKERERREQEALEAELADMQRRERERHERELAEAEEREAQRRERDRLEREYEAQRAEAERKERERLEEEEIRAQLAQMQRQERERQERELMAAQLAEAQRRERERQDEERAETLRLEVERRERERREREWIEAQWIETQRKERERQERERHERERLEAQLIEMQRRDARPPPLVPAADWQPVATAQRDVGASWSPPSERLPPVWVQAEAGAALVSEVMPPPLPAAVSGAMQSAARALAPPPREKPWSGETVMFMHEVPEKMWLGEPVMVRVALGRGTIAGFSRTFASRAGLDLEGDPVAETVSMSLYGRGDVFEIERQTERVQLLPSTGHLVDSLLELSDYGRWVWHVTPLIPGEHELFLRVSALFRDRRGVPTPVALPDQKVDVVITVPTAGSIIQSLAGWLRR